MHTQANSVYRYKFFGKSRRSTDFIFSQSQSINNLNNSYFNRDKHTGNDKRWRQTNSQEQFWEPTSEDVSLKRAIGPWKTIVLLPISLPASATSQLVCSLRWAAALLGFSPLSSNSRGRVPHFIRLSSRRRTSASRDKPSGWTSWAPGISLDGFEWRLHECNVKTFEVFISKWMTKVKLNYGYLLNSNRIKRRKVLLLLPQLAISGHV